MGRIYPTNVDWRIGLILIFTVAGLVGSAVPFFFGPPAQTPFGPAFGLFCLAVEVPAGWIPVNTNYEIAQTELMIRSAGFRWRIPLDSIVKVLPTNNPLSSTGPPPSQLLRVVESRVDQSTDQGRADR